MKKNYLLLGALALWSSLSFGQGFFDQVTYKGAFGTTGVARTSNGYNPDPNNTDVNWTSGWCNWDPQNTSYAEPTTELTGDITEDRTISGVVKLTGTVHVKNGATLTISAGTVIRGNTQNTGTLIIAKGAKINAIGTKTNPIIFTSGKPAGSRVAGDWGGILIIGNAQVNTVDGTRQYEALPNDPLARYGGGANPNNADNSGVMRYVRLEFPGYNYLPDQELNGLTLGAVGSETKIDYIQVSYSRDDSFEWFGGKSNHKYLVAFAGIDDDFDMDEGYAGNVQFILGVRHPKVFETASGGTSNGFEHDNNTGVGTAGAVNPNNVNPQPFTAPTISNATLIGPIKGTDGTSALVTGNKFGRAIELRSAVQTSIFNSVFTGYPTLMNFVSPSASITPSVQTKAASGDFSFRGVQLQSGGTSGIANFGTSANSPNGINSANTLRDWFLNQSPIANSNYQTSDNVNVTGTSVANLFVSPFYTGAATDPNSGISFTAVDFTIPANSPLTTGTSWSDPRIANNLGAINLVPSFGVSASTLAPITIQTDNITNNTRTFNVFGANLTSTSVTISSNNSNFTVSPTTFSITNGTISGQVTVTYSTTAPGVSSATITVTPNNAQPGVSNAVVVVSGTAVAPAAPVLSSNIGGLTFTPTALVQSAPQTILVSGVLLNGDLTVTAPTNFQISLSSASGFGTSVTISPSNKSVVNVPVYVVYNPANAGNHTGNVVLSATGASSVNVSVSANSNPRVSTNATSFIELQTVIGVPSREHRVTITSALLQSDLTVTMPANFQVSSTTGLTGNWVSSITIPQSATSTNLWFRYNRSSTGNLSSSLTIAGTGFNNVLVDVVGRAVGLVTVTQAGTVSVSNPSVSVSSTGTNFTVADQGKILVTSGFAFIGSITTVTGTAGDDILQLANIAPTALTNSQYLLLSQVSGSTISYASGSPVVTFTGGNIAAGTRLYTALGSVGIVAAVSGNTATLLTAPTNTEDAVNYYQLRGQPYIFTNTRSTSVMTNFGGTPSSNSQVTIAIQGFNLNGPITIACPSVFDLSLTTAGSWTTPVVNTGAFTIATSNWPMVSTLTLPSDFNGNLYVRYNPGTSYASHTGDLAIISAGINPLNINVRGNSAPDFTVTPNTLPLLSAVAGKPSNVASLSVNGSRLVAPVILTAPTGFQLSTDLSFTAPSSTLSLNQSTTGSLGTTVYVRYLDTNPNGNSASSTLNATSQNAQAVTINVSGVSSIAPTTILNVAGIANATLGGTAIEYTVSGSNLTSDIVINAPSSYGIALSNSSTTTFVSSLTLTTSSTFYGDVTGTLVYVKYLGTVDGVTGTLTVTTTGANQSISLNSKVTSLEAAVEVKNSFDVNVYPNPSEGNANIDVTLGSASDVTVYVSDLTGSIVATYTSGKLTSGTYQYTINDLKSGAYFVTILGDGYKVAKKLIVY